VALKTCSAVLVDGEGLLMCRSIDGASCVSLLTEPPDGGSTGAIDGADESSDAAIDAAANDVE
jgi:hypothetical protein